METVTGIFRHSCCHFKRLRVCTSMHPRNWRGRSSVAKALLRCVQVMYPFCRCPSCTLESSVHDCGSRRCTETRRHRNERLDTHAAAEVNFGNNYQRFSPTLDSANHHFHPFVVHAAKMPAIRFSRRGEDAVFENVGPSNAAWCSHLSWSVSHSRQRFHQKKNAS